MTRNIRTKVMLLLLGGVIAGLAPLTGRAEEARGADSAPAGDAAPGGSDVSPAPAGETLTELDYLPPRVSRGDFVLLPTIEYGSDNGFGFGAQLVRSFPECIEGRANGPTELFIKGDLTLRGRRKAEVQGEFRLADGRYHLKVKGEYSDYRRRFWGVGPDTPSENEELFLPREWRAYVELSRRVVARLDLGLRYEFESMRYEEVKAGGLLETAGYPCGCEGSVMGGGLIASWDTRDRVRSPTSGVLYQGFVLFFDDELGSGIDFNNWHLDLRNYFPLRSGHVLATQIFLYAAGGDVPLWRLAELGGREHTRGYRRARYRDRALMAVQAEYRLDLWRRLGVVGFAGVADVAPEPQDIRFHHLRPTLGGGLRVRLNKDGTVKARLDVAVGQNSARAYFGLGEAF